MARKVNTPEIVQNAARHLERLLGTLVTATITPERRDGQTDTTLTFTHLGRQLILDVEVKPYLTRDSLGPAAAAVRRRSSKGVLITRYVNPLLANALRTAGTQFIDCEGNAYLKDKSLLLYVTGNRIPANARAQQGHHLRPAGLQTVFALLCNPGLERAPYRVIAAQAAVALGTIGPALADLTAQGFIDDRPAGRILIRKDTLFDQWVSGFVEQLRPKLVVNRYRATGTAWWQKGPPAGALWGGEVAAFIKTGYLRPEMCTVYADTIAPETIIKNRLTMNAGGNVEQLRRFWTFEYADHDGPLVHPVLVYADLVAEPDKRRLEAAGAFRERYLDRYLKED